ncbi:MAG: hypothetical protein WBP98_05440, partial [Candidatus Sulfotelmatobacter sp.]
FVAMAWPIIPKPRKATRINDFLLVMKEPSGLDMSERIKVKQALENASDARWLCDSSVRANAVSGGTGGITRFYVPS